MKPKRRTAREKALQVLYELELNADASTDNALKHLENYFSQENAGQAADPFTYRVVDGVSHRVKELDAAIAKVSQNWRPGRMPHVDRNILRMGVFELLFCDDIPATVTINEMVELAKEFGSEETPPFVNGLLDKVKASLDRPEKAP